MELNADLACRCDAGQVVPFHGQLRVFTRAQSDVASFRMVTRQLIVQGSVTTGRVQRAFGVPLVSIKRGTKLYRARWVAGFFASQPRRPAKGRRCPGKAGRSPRFARRRRAGRAGRSVARRHALYDTQSHRSGPPATGRKKTAASAALTPTR